jgi:hypothetical protein
MATIFNSLRQSQSSNRLNDSLLGERIRPSASDLAHLASRPAALDENGLTEELDRLEKCAAGQRIYFYRTDWDADARSQIREYAGVCRCRTQGVDPSDLKTAGADATGAPPSEAAGKTDMELGDPFGFIEKLEKLAAQEAAAESDGPEDRLPVKLAQPDITLKPGAVVGIKGGEDYFIHSHLRIAPGQNSVTNPNAIEELAKSKDSRQSLRQQAKGRQDEIEHDKKQWQEKAAEDAKFDGYGKMFGSRSIRLSEASPAQGIIMGHRRSSLPEKTAGEKIKSQNQARQDSILRSPEGGREDWDQERPEARATISDLFAASLEQNLNAISKKAAATKTAQRIDNPQKYAGVPNLIPVQGDAVVSERMARLLAKRMDLDFVTINLDSLKSKWLGETESNLHALVSKLAGIQNAVVLLSGSDRRALMRFTDSGITDAFRNNNTFLVFSDSIFKGEGRNYYPSRFHPFTPSYLERVLGAEPSVTAAATKTAQTEEEDDSREPAWDEKGGDLCTQCGCPMEGGEANTVCERCRETGK